MTAKSRQRDWLFFDLDKPSIGRVNTGKLADGFLSNQLKSMLNPQIAVRMQDCRQMDTWHSKEDMQTTVKPVNY
jgi:hypothetical protein